MCTHWRLKSTQEEIALAVEGNFTEHHMFMIRMIRDSIADIERHIADLDAEIDRRMAPIDGIIERLCGIPSMDRTSVKELIAEIGVDMEVFPTADHLASWAGMSPGNNESAGKKKVRTRTTGTRPRRR
jgi:transposase